MKIVTAAEMRAIDRATSEQHGIPSLTLMENAGTAVAEFLLREYSGAQSFGVVCGKGNNGGDGLVAARKLHQAGRDVRVLLLAAPGELKGDAAAMHAKLPVTAVVARSQEELTRNEAQCVLEAEVLVDAILGTGFQPPMTGFYDAAMQAVCGARRKVVSVD
ncbi:MAG: NAD(P)H-hydrate epimerase, partial [Terriglobales bacterium]